MKTNDLYRLLDGAVRTRGVKKVRAILQELTKEQETLVLTIIANAGVHEIPKIYLRGDVYEASRGNWDAATEERLLIELESILSRVADKLRARAWARVYLIPTGHPILSLQIKAMVYRLLRINTIDLYYKAGAYFEVNIDQRAIAIKNSGDQGEVAEDQSPRM